MFINLKMYRVSSYLDWIDENIAEAKSLCQRLDANLGGTEIYSPLEFIFRQPKVVGKPRQVRLII